MIIGEGVRRGRGVLGALYGLGFDVEVMFACHGRGGLKPETEDSLDGRHRLSVYCHGE